ncbi:MFS general substrate transporter [Mycena chlorophos]|uniref:MFS general substrate transporter n=1 Tax=Mycena chlorophos TaxID=658473 RepID=A0A8H6SUL5_MYCCL|nr:MFS general substrate transporter [Mycena chlorophos]
MPTPTASIHETKANGAADTGAPALASGSASGLEKQSSNKKLLLLALFCLAFLLDAINSSSLFTSIPTISAQLGITDSRSVWLLAAYQLAFAALLLISGRFSDLYSPKWVFVCGIAMMGVFSLVGGFLRSQIPVITLRALMGGAGALTIPSAQHLIVHMYTTSDAQAKAIAVFGGMGAIGIVLGLFVGALLVTFTSWPWIFYVPAILCGIISICSAILIPRVSHNTDGSRWSQFRRLDLVGVFLFSVGTILLVFAVTSGSIDGWNSARVLVPLVLSIILVISFFLWESRLQDSHAAVPAKIWTYPNFKVLIPLALVPFAWWSTIFLLFSWLWEVVYAWSPITTAAHFLPIALGVFPGLAISIALQSQRKISHKWVIVMGFVLALIGSILLPFGNTSHHYWPFLFPGFLLGTLGCAIIYTTINVDLLANAPVEASGIISALFVCMLQVGGAVGSAIVTSIQTSVQQSNGGPLRFAGRAAGLWFLCAWVGVMGLSAIMLLKKDQNKD